MPQRCAPKEGDATKNGATIQDTIWGQSGYDTETIAEYVLTNDNNYIKYNDKPC